MVTRNTSVDACGPNLVPLFPRTHFPQRSCFVFPPPANSADKMNRLEELSEDQLEPDFVAAGNRFTDFVRTKAQFVISFLFNS